jgi:predicted ATPase
VIDDDCVSSAFVETIHIENFGCVHDARFELTRLHALIGPNDSGKSTVLSAIQTAGELIRIGAHRLARAGGLVPAIYEALWSRDRHAFDAIEAGVKRHFPTVNTLWLPTSNHSRKALGVILNDGTKVHTDAMSDGLLCWLAFAVLPHVNSTAILLIEEPETSLNPARISEVMEVLRTISSRIQVILTTHSPLVINELQPQEVTLLTRDERTGTRATRLDRTMHFQQRQRVYSLGELWLSFADGASETALVPQGHTNETKQPAG